MSYRQKQAQTFKNDKLSSMYGGDIYEWYERISHLSAMMPRNGARSGVYDSNTYRWTDCGDRNWNLLRDHH